MNIGSLFSGYGGLEMAVAPFFDGHVVWHSDIDPGACKVLAHHWPDIPNLGDITRIDWATVEPVDVLTGGFPCQDVSHAGKRAGLRPDTRTGLWSQMAYAIDQLRPRYVVAENVRGLLSASAHSDLEPCPWCLGDAGDGQPALRALGAVLADLAELGYDARWVGLRAADVGAPHGRFRVFIVATDTQRSGWDGRPGQLRSGRGGGAAPDPDGHALREQPVSEPGRSGAPLAGQPRALPSANPTGNGWDEGRPEPAGVAGGPDAAERGAASADPDSHGLQGVGRQQPVGHDADGRSGAETAWGAYEPAIRRWERILGRVAPPPTETSPKGSQRLSPAFVEWMQGLPAGHVTAVPGLSRNEQLKALGNGVVPQQAYAALGLLIDQLEAA